MRRVCETVVVVDLYSVIYRQQSRTGKSQISGGYCWRTLSLYRSVAYCLDERKNDCTARSNSSGGGTQGDRTILIIPLSWSRPEAHQPVRQSWSQAHGLMPLCCSAWLSAPPRWRGHPARPQSAHLGSPPLVRRLGGGRREGAVRQDQ